MSGTDLAGRVRERHPDMPIVYTSAHAPEASLVGELPGTVPFIGKPFVPTELVSTVRDAMGKA
jgi:DNA-binding NtrC family response regulator